MPTLEEIESRFSKIQILRLEAEQDEKDAELFDKYGLRAITTRRGLE